jgi:cysteine desulfurase family protein
VVLETREIIAALFGIFDSSRVVFTHSATEALNLAVRGILKPGDHVVTTSMEHNSLARPLHLASRQGIEVSCVAADAEGYLNPHDIAAALRPNTRLVAVTHCSNVTGTLQPVAEIGKLVHQAGSVFLVDAAQSAGSVPIDVKQMNIDLLAAPGHKGLMGPPGTGFLYIAEGISLEPLLVGGTGTASASLDQPDELPERFESGTLNTPALAGLAAGAAFVASIRVEEIFRHETALVRRLMEGLSNLAGIRIYGPALNAVRGSVVSFTIKGKDPSQIGFLLDHEYGISVRTGLHCAPQAHKTIGTWPGGTIRVSPGWFTAESEIERFIEAVEQIIGRE